MATKSDWAPKVFAVIKSGNANAAMAQIKVAPTAKDVKALRQLMEAANLLARVLGLDARGERFIGDSIVHSLHSPSEATLFWGEWFGMDPACLKEPETLLAPEWAAQRAYLEKYYADFEAALFGADFKDAAKGYAAYVDVDSVVDYYLINELFKNVDGAVASFFIVKQRDGKFSFGPIWDFDLALGNAGYNDVDKTFGWHIRKATWFARFFEDPAFAAKVKARWAALKTAGKFEEIFQYAQARASWLEKMQQKNFTTWPIFSWVTWYTRYVGGSYSAEVTEMLRWQRERYAWMDGELSK
jgi:hypothetical protein